MEVRPNLEASLDLLWRALKDAWLRFGDYVRGANLVPVGTAPLDRFAYGLAQPVIGARVLLRDSQLLKSALYPAFLLAVFCSAVALLGGGHSSHAFVRRFYRVFVVLAPLPSIVFSRHYARLAASAHRKLGFGDCGPRLEGLRRAVRKAVYQATLIAIAAAPALALLRLTPFLGRFLAQAAAALWALHWVVMDALDDARILESGETLKDVDLKNKSAPQAWFIRAFNWIADRLPPGTRRPARFFSRICDKLSLEWREEMAVAEGHKALLFGFGGMTAALLATPVLNLFFRPIIIVASVHLLGQLSDEAGAIAHNDSANAELTRRGAA